MSETDRQTDSTAKTTRWAFTAYKDQWHLFKEGHIPPALAEWGWNTEKCPETGREHLQGYLRTKQQVRLSQLKKQFPGVHLEPARNWEATKNYSGKVETRVPGTTPVSETSTIPDIYAYTAIIAKQLDSKEVFEDMVEDERRRIKKATPPGLAPDYGSKHVESAQQLMEHFVDQLVKTDIASGKLYAGHIAVNPQWICLWRRFGFQLIEGAKKSML